MCKRDRDIRNRRRGKKRQQGDNNEHREGDAMRCDSIHLVYMYIHDPKEMASLRCKVEVIRRTPRHAKLAQ
jgi:hypothetical protein